MHPKIIFLLSFTIFRSLSFAANADTVLNMVMSKPYFYNVVQNNIGEIFVGTANGMYALKEDKLSFKNSKPGYLKIGSNGIPEIDSSGISNRESNQYLHLLPYPDEKRQEYHSGNESQFYIVRGGQLFIFEIVPYLIDYSNQRIR